mmetsp:Transcript_49568/g.112520  ORF Transcript_49568/g.112520 Transcript_49568/m.112520 type:complete len:231 (-) Transcript_49568:65-757(-)
MQRFDTEALRALALLFVLATPIQAFVASSPARLGSLLVREFGRSQQRKQDPLRPQPIANFREAFIGRRPHPMTFSASVVLRGQSGDLADQKDRIRTPVYQLLSAEPRSIERPGSDHFYNDEVASHLHGYIFLTGGLAAHDEVFVFAFLALAASAAGATLVSALPANPRVPAAVAGGTLVITLIFRYGFGIEPTYFAETLSYRGPASNAAYWEAGIVALNVCWGAWGPWRK